MTTTSAGNGPSAGDGRDEDEDWGWFGPPRSADAPAASEDDERLRHADETEETEPVGRFARARQRMGMASAGRSVGSVAGGRGAGRALWAGTDADEGETETESGLAKSGSESAISANPTSASRTSVNRSPEKPRAAEPDAAEQPDSADTAISDPPDFDPWRPGAAKPSSGTSAPGLRAAPRGAPTSVVWPDGGPESPRGHPASPPRTEQSSRSPRLAPPRNPLYDGGPATDRTPAAPPAASPAARPAGNPSAGTPPAGPPSAGTPPAGPSPAAPLSAMTPPAGLSSADAESRDTMLIRQTLEEVEPQADAATAYFYALLFVQFPELRDLFPASMDAQRDRLFRALLTAVRLADEEEALGAYLSNLGRGHRKYGTLPEHYPAVGECLLGALSQYAPRIWSQETEDAWVRAYTLISQTMIDAAADDEARAPAWWNAEIVRHEQPTPEIAVITVRADQPYPFLAGQYTSIETPWWPRVWRHYSFASAPRSDGLLTFHVKAVPTGWVSSALVHRAQPGDVLRLGPPAGAMTVDHTTDSGLLCVGGGTGLAPIRALVEDVVQQGRRPRPVEVFYGARSDRDLYDLESMTELERQHGWLSVRPVVAFPLRPGAGRMLHGQLPDAVRKSGPWRGYDGYLSGPPGLIRSGVEALVDSGVRVDRIRHDSLAELMGAERPA